MDSPENFTKMSGIRTSHNTIVEDLENLKLSDFKLLGLLGDGAYGEVWKARHKLTGQFFALKIVEKVKVSRMLSQFNREINILYTISHPNIIRLYQHFEDSLYFYLVMELVENGTLRDRISVLNPLSEPEIQSIFWQILQAVDYLHSQVPPIIHRDIKPENIMFDNNLVKLCDFGFSNYYDQERKTSCGTLEYLSPEIVERRSHDTSVDIWSLGILLYELFTGVTPFSDGNNEQVLMNISQSFFRVPLNIPPLVKDVISLMLDKNQTRRFTALEIKQHRWLEQLNTKNIKEKNLLPPKNLQKKSGIFSQKDFMLTPSPKDLKSSMAFSFRKSINSMKTEIMNKSSGVKNTKTLVSKHRTMLSLNSEKLKEIEKKLEIKKEKFLTVCSKEKIFLSKIRDADYDILRLMDVCEVGVFKQKVLELREEFEEKVKEFGIQSDILKNLRQQVKITTISMIEKEEELKELRKTLSALKENSIKSYNNTEVQVRELKEFVNILRTKLKVTENPIPLIGVDQRLSEEIVNFISEYMENSSDSLNLNLKRIVLQTDNRTKALEKKFSGLKIEYSEEREKIINEIKKKKDFFFSGLKRKQFFDYQKVVGENRMKENEMLTLVEQARMKESLKCADIIDIAIARNKLYV